MSRYACGSPEDVLSALLMNYMHVMDKVLVIVSTAVVVFCLACGNYLGFWQTASLLAARAAKLDILHKMLGFAHLMVLLTCFSMPLCAVFCSASQSHV